MPPDTSKTATWKLALAYLGFFLASLVLGLYLTFPYDSIKQRVQREADASGYYVRMGSMGPGLLGVTASEVRISKKMGAAEETAPPALLVDKISLRPALFPPGVGFRASLLDGTISGNVGFLGDVKVRVNLDDLTLSEPETNLKGFTGMDLAGKVDGKLVLDIPQVAPPGGKVKQPDLGQANGKLTLKAADLAVNGGTVTVPMYGEPTPMDLPKIVVGALDGEITFEKGVGKFDEFHAKGSDLELFVAGTLKLSRRLEYSEPALDLKLKAEPEFVKRLGLIGAGLSVMGPDKADPSFRAARIAGYLNRPAFQPAR